MPALGLLTVGSGRGRGNVASRSRRRNGRADFTSAARGNRSAASRSDFTAAGGDVTAATTANLATAATIAATATITAVATMTATAAVGRAAAIGHRTTAIHDATAATAAMAAEQAGVGLLLTAHEGDADDREENRDAKQHETIHPTSSKKTYRYRKRRPTSSIAVLTSHPRSDGRDIGSEY